MPQPITIGSQAHKELMCRFFIDSHLAFDPAAVCWPELRVEELARLRSLPFWAEAVATERMTACTVQALAPLETDPLLHAAIALQDFTLKGHQALSTAISPRRFLQLCLQENDRRLGHYDARLLRPRLVPGMARALSRLLP